MWTTKTKLRIASVPLSGAGCRLLYSGTGMPFLAPGSPYESFWKSMLEGRFVYGVLPTLASPILLAAVGWLWDRSNGCISVLMAIGKSFLLACGAVLLFWIVLGWPV
jgi:hypothetical protein